MRDCVLRVAEQRTAWRVFSLAGSVASGSRLASLFGLSWGAALLWTQCGISLCCGGRVAGINRCFFAGFWCLGQSEHYENQFLQTVSQGKKKSVFVLLGMLLVTSFSVNGRSREALLFITEKSGEKSTFMFDKKVIYVSYFILSGVILSDFVEVIPGDLVNFGVIGNRSKPSTSAKAFRDSEILFA